MNRDNFIIKLTLSAELKLKELLSNLPCNFAIRIKILPNNRYKRCLIYLDEINESDYKITVQEINFISDLEGATFITGNGIEIDFLKNFILLSQNENIELISI